MNRPLLEVKNLTVQYRLKLGLMARLWQTYPRRVTCVFPGA